MAKQEMAHEKAALDLRSKYLQWGEIKTGDCHQIDGALTFLSDGRGFWTCTTWTDHTYTTDVWHCSFSVRTPEGVQLFTVGQFDGPDMSEGSPESPRYYWWRPFIFDPDVFDAIGSGLEYSEC